MTTALQCTISYKPYTLAGFEPGIFCSVGGRDDQNTRTCSAVIKHHFFNLNKTEFDFCLFPFFHEKLLLLCKLLFYLPFQMLIKTASIEQLQNINCRFHELEVFFSNGLPAYISL
jgi:hypothetical protein